MVTQEMVLAPRERIRLTIAHQETDRVPCGELLVEEAFLDRLYPDMAGASWREKMIALSHQAGFDLVTIQCHPQTVEDAFKEISWWAKESDLFVMALVDGMFWHSSDPWPFEKFLSALIKGAKQIRALISQKKEKAMDLTRHCLEVGAHGCVIGDDIAFDRGLFASLTHLEKWIFPGLSAIAESIKRNKGVAFFHSCGKVKPLLDSIISLGFDGFHGLSPSSGNDFSEAYSKARGRMTLMGGFDLDGQTPLEIQLLKEHILTRSNLKKNYILGTSAGLSRNTPLQNFRIIYGS